MELDEQEKIRVLQKENRILRKKLERIELEQVQLEQNNLRKETLLRKVIEELQRSQSQTEQKSAELETALRSRKRQQESLRLIMEGTASHTGGEFFRCCVRYLAEVLQVRYAAISEIVDENHTRARTIALWTGSGFVEGIEFELAGTPCGVVIQEGFSVFPDSLQTIFPESDTVATLDAESYMGIDIRDTYGNILGNFGIMHTQAMTECADVEESILRIFAARVAAEIERDRAQSKLRIQAQDLEMTLKELQNTQVKLLHSEKMSSLGQLVAGIAHEINNPVGFIYSNLAPAMQYIQDLLDLIKLYQQYYPNPAQPILQHIDKIELDYVISDLPNLFNSMEVGTERIQQIVLSLRTFSHLDEADTKPVEIHEGIDSTLMILEHRLKGKAHHPRIEVIKDYGNLPLIECNSGQLNQVFMNIFVNAIDALEDKFKKSEIINDSQPIILIKTEVINHEWLAIRIKDNGIGMSEEVISKLFDPFFTTKPVGKGTGMGMSISYQIITENHRGKLFCNSVFGKGTEFVIEIPIKSTFSS
jgi:two-component system NtrC family sensor kinase